MKPLTELVVDYIRHEGYEVVAWRALEIPDNLDVGRHDPARLPEIVKSLPYQDADAIVLSACVQMPSLPAVAKVEAMTGKPVITAAIATTYAMLPRTRSRADRAGRRRAAVGRLLSEAVFYRPS